MRRRQEPLCDSDIIVARVQAPDNRLRALHVVRRAGRSQRRDLLQLRPGNPGLWGFAPALRALGADLGFVPFVIGTCSVIYVLTLLASRGDINMSGMFGFLGLLGPSLFLFGATGPGIVVDFGRWWTIVSASWLHGSALHIVFNMLSVRQLAPAVADMYGPGRMVIIYTAGGVAGFALSVVGGCSCRRFRCSAAGEGSPLARRPASPDCSAPFTTTAVAAGARWPAAMPRSRSSSC